jgi:murein DD-endopeptidase MepM/ murein hydrolase activator NlpD
MKVLRPIFAASLVAFGCGFAQFVFLPSLVVTTMIPQMPFGGDRVEQWMLGTPQPVGGDGPIDPGPGGSGPPITLGPGRCPDAVVTLVGGTSFQWPADTTYISGWRFNPVTHPGVDIGTPEGSPIYASEAGTVVFSGWSHVGYGETIVLDHGNGWWTRYAHLSAIIVACDQTVQRGAVIALSGNTGRSTGPHLHFELSGPQGRIDPCLAILGTAC